MFFGKYLVDEKIISDEELIACMLEQVKSLPTSLEVIVENNILSSEEVVSLITKSIIHSKDVLHILREYEDGDKKVDSVTKLQSSSSLNLSNILIDKTSLTHSQLDELYKKFKVLQTENETLPQQEKEVEGSETGISEAALESLKELQGDDFSLESILEENVPEREKKKTVTNTEEGASFHEVAISSAALESLKELGISPEELADIEGGEVSKESQEVVNDKEVSIAQDPSVDVDSNEYVKIYTEKKNKKLVKIIAMIENAAKSDDDVANYFNSLYKELHVVKGATALVDVKYSKKLINIWELVIDKLFKMQQEEIKAWVYNYVDILKDSVNLLWDIRCGLLDNDSEDLYMKNESIRDKYILNVGSLKKIISEMS